MPTSNGQVTGRDIRQQAVKTLHIVDEAVTTSKIPDLAVTFPDKIDDPIWVTAFESEPGFDVSLTTTYQECASIDIDVPAWVDSVNVFAVANWQITNSSGADQRLDVSCRVNDSDDGGRSMFVINGDLAGVDHFENANLIGVAGASFNVSAWVKLSTGTNSDNSGAVWGIVIGTR